MKKCPYCAEMIKEEATVCRYCGKRIRIKSLKNLLEKRGIILTTRFKVVVSLVVLAIIAVLVLIVTVSSLPNKSGSDKNTPKTTNVSGTYVLRGKAGNPLDQTLTLTPDGLAKLGYLVNNKPDVMETLSYTLKRNYEKTIVKVWDETGGPEKEQTGLRYTVVGRDLVDDDGNTWERQEE